jgi:hypothetical protein
MVDLVKMTGGKFNVTELTTGNEFLDRALSYVNVGWYIFPVWGVTNGQCDCGDITCSNQGKHPHPSSRTSDGQLGMNAATLNPEQVKEWWTKNPTMNIGCHMERSGLIAVDIDPRNGGLLSMELLEEEHGLITSDVLQFTGGGGEHRIFQLPKNQNFPGKLAKGVDLKANGYIIVEPSTHKSGGTYEFEGSSDPTDGCLPSPLPDWIRGYTKSDFTTDKPKLVSKHLPLEQKQDLIDCLQFIDSNDREVWVNVGNALSPYNQDGFDIWDRWSQTSDKYNEKDTIRVWRSLKYGSFTISSIFHLAQTNGWTNPQSIGGSPEIPAEEVKIDEQPPVKPIETEETTTEEVKTTPFPRLNKTIDWLDKYSTKSNPVISLAGSLSIVQAATARVYRSEHYYNGTTAYIAVVARTGAGKDYIRKAFSRLFSEAGYSNNTSVGNFISGASIRDTLAEYPWVIAYLDEFGDMIKHGTQDKGGPARDRLSTLRKAYSTEGELERTAYANRNRGTNLDSTSLSSPVIDPHLGIVGLTTKQQFLSAISEGMLEDGTMNRFIYLSADATPSYNRLPQFEPPKWLVTHVQDLRSGGPNVASTGVDIQSAEIADMRPTYQTVSWAEDALIYYREIGDVEDPTTIIGSWCKDSSQRTQMAARARENAMRLATGITVYESFHEITKETLQWCFEFVFQCVNDFHLIYLEHAQTDKRLEQMRIIINAIVKQHNLKKSRSGYNGVTKSELTLKTTKKLDRKTRDTIMADLIESGMVSMDSVHNGGDGKGGRVVTKYTPNVKRCVAFLKAEE